MEAAVEDEAGDEGGGGAAKAAVADEAEDEGGGGAATAAAILGLTLPHTAGQRRQIKPYVAGIPRTGEYDVMDPRLQDRLMKFFADICEGD